MSGKTSRDSCGVVEAGAEHVLDRAVGAVAGLGELVDVVPVAVLGEGGGAGAVVATRSSTPHSASASSSGCTVADGARLGMLGGEGAERGPGVGGVHQHLVVGPGPVEGAQQPEVLVPLLRRGEVKQAQPVI